MALFFTIACLLAALALLCALAVIDLRTMLLPNKLVFPFFILGLVFHFATGFVFAMPVQIMLGTIGGGGLLWLIRIAAMRFYGEDALGLGDVKLMGAAGAWLGPQDILTAIILGALAGIVHGIAISVVKKCPLKTLSLPAGPGFIVGIIIAGLIKFWPLLTNQILMHTDFIVSI